MGDARPLTRDDLEERLERFLLAEHRASRRATLLLHELPVDERVAKGVSVTDLSYLDARGATVRFQFPQQACKLREGDWMVLGRGRPVGPEVAEGLQVIVSAIDPLSRTVTLEPVGREWELGATHGVWTLDYVSSDTNTPRLASMVRDALRSRPGLVDLVTGQHAGVSGHPPSLAVGLDASQTRAAGEALSNTMTLIHGPPGTGKTKVLASVIDALAGQGKRILVSAFTHRAIDNVLHAVTRDAGATVVKLGRRSPDLNPAIPCVQPTRLGFSRTVSVVGATVYALTRLPREMTFDAVVIDEAGQLPLAHAMVALGRSGGMVILAGDHLQLPPVLTTLHLDEAAAVSVFAHLANLYPTRVFMLETSYRLPPGLCRFPSETFYEGRLTSSRPTDPDAASPAPRLRHPELEAVWSIKGPLRALWVNHQGYGAFSPPEAEAVARLTTALVVDLGVVPEEIAVVAPHRAQVREITDRLWRRLGPGSATPIVVDTVERMQGQERDVIVLSLTVSDPWFMADEIDFILNPNRLNVSLTRARKLLVVVGSREFFRVFPASPDHLEAAWLIRKLEQLLLPVAVDLTAEAHGWVGLPAPESILASPQQVSVPTV